MSARIKTDGTGGSGRGDAPTPARAEPGDDWTWMVAADPTFSLEEGEGAPRGGRV